MQKSEEDAGQKLRHLSLNVAHACACLALGGRLLLVLYRISECVSVSLVFAGCVLSLFKGCI
jgi:hypothetical protein